MITQGSSHFRKYVLNMNRTAINRTAMSSVYEALREGCANGLTPGEAFDSMLDAGRADQGPLLSRITILR